ncbi:hypothetical protein Tco_1224256, partial [Tanacetum coccineum]
MGILYKIMKVQNKLGSNNLVLVLKQESMEYMMKNVFGLSGSKMVGGQVTEREDKHGLLGKGAGKGISNWVEDQDRLSSSAIRFKTPVDMLGFFGWLASIKQGMLEPVKVKCIFLGYGKGILSKKIWRFDDVTSKAVLYRNMGFNENREYNKTFIGSGVGTGLVQVLQGVEFKVEPQENHTFEVEPHRNVDHVVGSQEVQTHDLIYYHSARDREQHSAWELFRYKEDSNDSAFAVAAVDKIYGHELLTFNNIVACEVIFKWEAGLKDDMDAWSDVYVLSNGCKKYSDDSDGYYWEYTP